jgi:rubrerythrin
MRPLHDLILEAASRQGPGFTSRRNVLALAGAAAAAPAVVGIETALAKKGKGKGKGKGKDKDKKNNDRKKDIAVLNFALTLEHLEYAFYRDGLAQFTAGDFDAGVFDLLQDILLHEDTHVDTLIDVISGLGGDPVEEACYDFGAGFDDPEGFLGIAQLLENTGVMAYTGAIATIKSGELQTASATIATVEARHASYLNLINGDNPFPDSFDEPKSQAEILAAAGGFFVDCP